VPLPDNDAKVFARELWDALWKLRLLARKGELPMGAPHRPTEAEFRQWRVRIEEKLPSVRPILDRARDAVPTSATRRVFFGYHEERTALAILLTLLDNALARLRGDSEGIALVFTPQDCAMLEESLGPAGQWKHFWLALEEDFALLANPGEPETAEAQLPSAEAPAPIVDLGNSNYRVGEWTGAVEDREHRILQAFAGEASSQARWVAIKKEDLIEISGEQDAGRILNKLAKKAPFTGSIRCPGKKGRGGYQVYIAKP
jgi:hypothetical protein